MAIGQALGDNEISAKTYVVVGYAVKVKAYDTQYKSQTFYMSDDATATNGDFTAYQCKIAEPGLNGGEFVAVTGKILNFHSDQYGNTVEIKQGNAEKLWGAGIENVVLTEKASKVIVDGVLYIVRDGKLFDVRGAQVR